jgi:hypothetical protein
MNKKLKILFSYIRRLKTTSYSKSSFFISLLLLGNILRCMLVYSSVKVGYHIENFILRRKLII